MSVSPELIAAYRAAIYEVDVSTDRVVRFHVARPCAPLQVLLQSRGATSAALLTAYNPQSQQQSESQNIKAHRVLLDALARQRKDYVTTRARDPLGVWPIEPGLLIFNMSRQDGLTLARAFQQHAFVLIEKDADPALVFAAS